MVIEWAHMGAFNQFVIEEMAHQFMMGPLLERKFKLGGFLPFHNLEKERMSLSYAD